LRRRWRRQGRIVLGLVAIATVLATSQAMAQASVNPRWQSTGTTIGISKITWLSCSSARNCVAFGGTSVDAEVAGSWAPATPIANLPTGATIRAIACPAPLDCVVGGSSGGQAFLLDEVSGVWGAAQLIGGTAPYTEGSPMLYGAFTSSITAISCWSPGKCAAAGNYTVETEPTVHFTYAGPGFATAQSSGTWRAATFLGGVDGVAALSCTSPSACTLGGYQTTFQIFISYPIVTNTAVADTETGTGWAPAVVLAGLTKLGGKTGWIDSRSSSLSCVSPGNCTLGGNDEYAPDFDGNPASLYNAKFYGFVVREVHGRWASARELTALRDVPDLACSSINHCVAADRDYVYLENLGRWGASREIKVSGHALWFGAVACSIGGPCLAAGAERGAAYAILARAGMWTAPEHLASMTAVVAASCPVDNACTVAGGSRVISQS